MNKITEIGFPRITYSLLIRSKPKHGREVLTWVPTAHQTNPAYEGCRDQE
jgi:hypothetical protein